MKKIIEKIIDSEAFQILLILFGLSTPLLSLYITLWLFW